MFWNIAEQPVKILKQLTFVQILEANSTHYYMCEKYEQNQPLPTVLLQFWNAMVYFYCFVL